MLDTTRLAYSFDRLCQTINEAEEAAFVVGVQLIAQHVRDNIPNAVRVRLENSDQGDHLTGRCVVLADGIETDRDDARYQQVSDTIEQVCGWISWSRADRQSTPGWHITVPEYAYEIDIEEVLDGE